MEFLHFWDTGLMVSKTQNRNIREISHQATEVGNFIHRTQRQEWYRSAGAEHTLERETGVPFWGLWRFHAKERKLHLIQLNSSQAR